MAKFAFKKLSAKHEGHKDLIESIRTNDITLAYGPAGTGKTATTLSVGLELINEQRARQIVVVRRMTKTFDEDIGALPGGGDAGNKFMPYAGPVVDALGQMMEPEQVGSLFQTGVITIIPVCWARGRTFTDSFVLVDEIQQMTPEIILCILTRLGNRSKMVLTGDPDQADIAGVNGVDYAWELLHHMLGVGVVELDESQIVRHPLVAQIVKRSRELVELGVHQAA